MPTRKSGSNSAGEDSGSSDVAAYLRTLDHPLKPGLEAVRQIILGADPRIAEAIKWNAPSFRVGEYFATTSIRKDAVFIVLHLGAKVSAAGATGMKIDDPKGLLTWLAKDRATVSFADITSIRRHEAAFADIVRQWIRYLR